MLEFKGIFFIATDIIQPIKTENTKQDIPIHIFFDTELKNSFIFLFFIIYTTVKIINKTKINLEN